MALRRVVVAVVVLFIPTYSQKTKCMRHKWAYFEKARTYIHIHFTSKTFEEAKSHCLSAGGGDLLMVKEVDMNLFIREYFSEDPEDVERYKKRHYWMGLTLVDYKVNHSYQWVDGSRLGENDYQQWPIDHEVVAGSEKRSCVAVEWYNSHEWRPYPCSTKHLFVCQARKACASRPMLIINNGVPLENTTVSFTKEQDVQIQCVPQGYDERVIKVALICDSSGHRQVGVKRVRHDVHLGYEANGWTCLCATNDEFNRTEESFITFEFKIPPQLTNQKDSVFHNFYVVDRLPLTIALEVLAFPTPHIFQLVFEGSVVNDSCCDVTTTLTKSVYNVINIRFVSVEEGDTGNYNLLVDNGVGESLLWSFGLRVVSNSDSNVQFAIGASALFMLMGTMLTMVICRGIRNRQRVKRSMGSECPPPLVEEAEEEEESENSRHVRRAAEDIFHEIEAAKFAQSGDLWGQTRSSMQDAFESSRV